jgi:long-chain acyl-CoA synthetase
LGHSYGLGNLVMPLILQGTAMVCAGIMCRASCSNGSSVTASRFSRRARAASRPGRASARTGTIDSLRTVISAGAVLTPAVAQAFFARYGIKIHNFYGSSETGGICYDRTGSASLTGRSVGKPLAGVSVTVKAGRVTVESPAVAARGGRWRLGDFGEWNGRGELVLLGRAGQGANIGGKKVHPLEVERVLRALPGVTDAAVWLWQSGGPRSSRRRSGNDAFTRGDGTGAGGAPARLEVAESLVHRPRTSPHRAGQARSCGVARVAAVRPADEFLGN